MTPLTTGELQNELVSLQNKLSKVVDKKERLKKEMLITFRFHSMPDLKNYAYRNDLNNARNMQFVRKLHLLEEEGFLRRRIEVVKSILRTDSFGRINSQK